MITRAAERARALVYEVRMANELRWRQVPRFAVGPRQTRDATVFHLSPHQLAPSGGVRNIYRHVDTLNEAGISAAVVHAKPGFRASWFENRTRVMHAAQVVVQPEDVLVIPECYGPSLSLLPPDRRVVVFNQGAYHTFDHLVFDDTVSGSPYSGLPGLTAILTVSTDSAELLRYAFPKLTIQVARLVLDGAIFHPNGGRRRRQIAHVTSRRRDELEQLRHLVRAGGLLERWELVPIQGRTDRQTAEIMRESAIFLSLSEREGFGLPPAEAMACGCYVVGYSGLGGREFFDEAYSRPVPEGDLGALVRALQGACDAYESNPLRLEELGRQASERMLERYAQDRLREDLLEFYRSILDAGAPDAGPR